jgi:hypothetical protein
MGQMNYTVTQVGRHVRINVYGGANRPLVCNVEFIGNAEGVDVNKVVKPFVAALEDMYATIAERR